MNHWERGHLGRIERILRSLRAGSPRSRKKLLTGKIRLV